VKNGRPPLSGIPAAALAFCVLLFLPGLLGAADPSGLLPEGEAAPAIESVTIEGTPFVLQEELAGGPVFLVFWSIF
jgi:hypothetical protein